jgi:hypothetical protein
VNKLRLLAIGLAIAVPVASIAADAGTRAARSERGELVHRIVMKWGVHVQEAHRADVRRWAMELVPLFARAPLPALKRAATARTFEQMNNELLVSQPGGNPAVLANATRDVPGKALGDADQDLVYVPVTPCRIIDTRVAGGAIAANTTRGFDVTSAANYAAQGGENSNCNGVGAAGSFAAAAINFTVVTPGAAGYITAFPFGAAQPLAATVNYTAGDIRGNFAVVKLDQGAAANELSVYTFAQTHLVADIVGYYRRTPVPSMECINTTQTSVVIPANGTDNVNAPNCLAGYVQTATNCETTSWLMPIVFFNGGTCSARNNSTSDATLRASRTCCRVRID